MSSCSHSASSDLVRAWMFNVQQAIVVGQVEQAEILLDHLGHLLAQCDQPDHVSSAITLDTALGLDRGISRQYSPNEDFPFAHHWRVTLPCGQIIPVGLFIVADGMGGHENGQEASRLLVQTMVDFIVPATGKATFAGSPPEIQALLVESIQLGNQVIYQCNNERECMMGTTVTALLLAGPVAVIANVGDSRTYLLRAGQALWQVTRDHSVVADMLQRGEITAEQAWTHAQRNQITRCIGSEAPALVDTFVVSLEHQDRLLLCSDGVSDMIHESEIERVLATQELTAQERVEHLIAKALRAGGKDNISMVVVEVSMDVALVETMLFKWH
jgi:serine/threonine protein phosphatase PrpC